MPSGGTGLKAEMGNAAGTPLLWLEEQTSQKLEEKLQSQANIKLRKLQAEVIEEVTAMNMSQWE